MLQHAFFAFCCQRRSICILYAHRHDKRRYSFRFIAPENGDPEAERPLKGLLPNNNMEHMQF